MKKEQGITLIALIITIIVLLILAGVTINLTIGERGVFKTAQNAQEEHIKSQLKEELELGILDIETDKITKGQEMKREDLVELGNIGAIMENYGIPAEGEYKDYYFEVDENYVVTIIGKLKGERPTINIEILTEGIVTPGGKVEIKVIAGISKGKITKIEATNGAVLKTDTSLAEKIFEVSANGIYYFKVTAENGRSAIASIEVNTIIEKPVIEIKNIEKTSFTIEVTNNYKGGLVKEYKYYVGGTLKSPINTIAKEFTVTGLTEETKYTNIYVEAYIGEQKLISEAKEATTKPVALEYSWEELEKVAKAISKDSSITKDTLSINKTVEGKEYTLKVGDIKKVLVDGKYKITRIMGFNHDELTDKTVYGGENTYAGISFEFVDSITNARMNSTSTNLNGWGATEIRGILNNTTINNLENRNQIKEVQKQYIKIYNDANSVTTSNDKLWLLSCSEIWNNGYRAGYHGYAITKEGEQYKYYKDINENYGSIDSRIIKEEITWWLRSPDSRWNTDFSLVLVDGSCNWAACSVLYGVTPGFAI